MGGLSLPYHGTQRNRDNLVNHASISTDSPSAPGPSKSNSSASDSSSNATYFSGDSVSGNLLSGFDTYDAQRSRDSAHGHFQGAVQQLDPLTVMKEVLDKLFEDGVPGPQLLRLYTEFNLELGRGTQFRVTTASRQHRLMLQRAHDGVSETQLKQAMALMLDSVVKRAHWIPDHVPRRVLAGTTDQEPSGERLRKELHNQLRSAKAEIDKLCKKAIRKHRNIVELRGWGLCLDTFEEVTPLNTRIPLLLLERATCNLGDFLASSVYDRTAYSDLYQICTDIGAGLGGLHQGSIAHGDMKPENVLLFRSDSESGPTWTAKLCDFGNAESKPDQISHVESKKFRENLQRDLTQTFEYTGTPGWTPPEEDLKKLNFEGLKLCDIFAYGLILWRVFEIEEVRGFFDVKTQRRMRNIAAPIDEENMPAYRDKDRAYVQSAIAIKKSKIIPATDVNRMLKVLRAALQPVPDFRDLRPWRFFNKTYYPKIDDIDERPSQQHEGGVIWAANIMKSSLLPSYAHLARNISDSTDLLSNMARNYLGSLRDNITPFLPELKRRSQEQQVFELVFNKYSAVFGLGTDMNSLQSVGYGRSVPDSGSDEVFLRSRTDRHAKYHHALKVFRHELERFCVMSATEPVHDRWNAYARIRSRLKLCCEEVPTMNWRSPSTRFLNCLELTLDVILKELSTTATPSARGFLVFRTSNDQIFSTIAWLCRGEIGQYELKSLSVPEKIWYLSCESRLVPELRTNLFLLFMQNGCFIGDEFDNKAANQPLQSGGVSRKKTAFRHFLEIMIEGSQDVGFRSDWLAQVCTNIVSLNANSLPGVGRDNRKVRFFFRGENPEDASQNSGESENEFSDIFSTTILHEAVLASCYTAVKHLVDSGFPLNVWNNDRYTALDYARTYANGPLESWRLVNNNLIIGLLTKRHGRQSSGINLPLGWEEIQSEYGNKLYLESTVNPQNPSITFRPPQFSLLQERRIAIGPRKDVGSGQEYRFDLVRFIQRPKLETVEHRALHFDDDWYKRDVIRIKASSAAEASPHEDDRLWIRFPARVARESKVIILRDYSSILLAFIPLSIAARGNSWNTQVSLVLSTVSLVGLARTWDINLADIYPNSIPSNLGQSIISTVGSCSVELVVGISGILRGQIGFTQAVVIGSILCNQLLVPGIGLLAMGLRFSEIPFNLTVVSLMSNLIILASALSTILFAFSLTRDNSKLPVENTALLLSRIASIIAIAIFLLWLAFRYKTHNALFDDESRDGYEAETTYEPMIAPIPALIASTLTLALIIFESDSLVLSVASSLPATQTTMGMFLVPTIIRLGKHWEAVRPTLNTYSNLDVTLGLTIGFTVTVSLFLVPVLVIFAWAAGIPFTLNFGLFKTVVYGLCGWIPAFVLVEGRSNFFRGVELLIVFALITLPSLFTVSDYINFAQ